MKRTGITCGLLMAALIAAGCTKESDPGGPGAGGTTTTNGTATNGKTTNGTATNGTTTTPRTDNGTAGDTEAEERTFTLEVPALKVDITQGMSQEITLSIDREDEFHEAVKLSFTAPDGVTVTPEAPEVGAEQEVVKVQIAVADTVAPGEVLITVNATPQTGRAVSQTVTVKVNAPE